MAKRPRPDSPPYSDERPMSSNDPHPWLGNSASSLPPTSDDARALNTGSASTAATIPKIGSRYKYAMVCSSNINRSMEAHVALLNQRLRVNSYGAGR